MMIPDTTLAHHSSCLPTWTAGPVGWPIIGNMVEYALKGPPLMCQQMELKYGKVFKVCKGLDRLVCL